MLVPSDDCFTTKGAVKMASSLTLGALIGEVLDLNVKGMQKNHRLAKAVGDASMSQFLSRLECKCTAAGKTVVKVSH